MLAASRVGKHIMGMAILAAILTVGFCAPSSVYASGDMTEMDIEALMNVEVTTVSKTPQRLSDSAAAVFVITAEDIRRSGVTTIPDALRMVPGLQVGRVDANKWAVTSRGFNGVFANKLLVLIDGRSVYTPSFSGVYWDVQDTLLEDIDRIEVVRGPGASLWGANAVNGVINIITKHSSGTTGGLVTAGAGTEERYFGGARYGARIADGAYARAYVKYFDRDESTFGNGLDAHDDWRGVRGGFRMDWDVTDDDTIKLQGDIYASRTGGSYQRLSLMPPYSWVVEDDGEQSGGNVLCRWTRGMSPESDLYLQVYYDGFKHDMVLFSEYRDTVDVELQHSFGLFGFNSIVWGVGYRYTSDILSGGFELSISPETEQDQVVSAFVQDDISVIEDSLNLIIGSKFEHNDYSGFEVQPSAKLIWTPVGGHAVWASVSRAVRTPSRGEVSSRVITAVIPPGTPENPGPVPVTPTFIGTTAFDSENVISYELGYRTKPAEMFSLDLALFFNDFKEQRTGTVGAPALVLTPVPHVVYPVATSNSMSGEGYGAEASVDLRLMDWWLVQASYTFLKMEFHAEGGLTETQSELSSEGGSPQNQVSVRSKMNLPYDVEFDAWLRYVDRVKDVNVTGPHGRVGDYITLDLRLGWRPVENIELSVVGQNLLDDSHQEYIPELAILPAEVERSVYGKVTWSFD